MKMKAIKLSPAFRNGEELKSNRFKTAGNVGDNRKRDGNHRQRQDTESLLNKGVALRSPDRCSRSQFLNNIRAMKEAPPALPSALRTQPLQALLWAGT